jgi:hypothetical protein
VVWVGLAISREVELRDQALHVPEGVPQNDHDGADSEELLLGVDLPSFPLGSSTNFARRLTLLDKGDYTANNPVQLEGVGQVVYSPVSMSPIVLDQGASEGPSSVTHYSEGIKRTLQDAQGGIRRQPRAEAPMRAALFFYLVLQGDSQ